MTSKTPTECVDCGRTLRPSKRREGPGVNHIGRGLCGACYARARLEGVVDDYPRMQRLHGDATREDLEWFDQQGCGITEVCQRLEVSRKTLHRWCIRNNQLALYRRFVTRDEPDAVTTYSWKEDNK